MSLQNQFQLQRSLIGLKIRISTPNSISTNSCNFNFFTYCTKVFSVNLKICLILAHPDLSAYRVVLSWHRIIDHIWYKENA